jgi:hypothetical protein
VDAPFVPEPSGLDGNIWGPDVNHTPLLGYIPYLLTGDPFFLENMQMMASWLIGASFYARANGRPVVEPDPNTPTMPGFPRSFPSWRLQTRGLAWALRTYTACYLATPASVPSWLLPKAYYKAVLQENQQQADSWGTNYASQHPTLPQYPSQIAQGILECYFYDEIFFLAYLMMAGAFAINQAGLAEWQPYIQWASTSPFAYGNGTNGAPKTCPTPYIMWVMPFGTDYNGAPLAFNNPAVAINFALDTGMLCGTYNKAASWGLSSASDALPIFSNAWASGAPHHCNSWMVEMRSGVPALPNAGDTVSITISGAFTRSPVTVSHTITSRDLGNASTPGTLTYTAINVANLWNDASVGDNPVTDGLVAAINGNASLSAAGIKAAYTNANPGPGSFHTEKATGRIYLSFNSDGSSAAGGPVIGDILITASMTTATNNSMYVSPNGDGVNWGTHNAACFHRKVCYQAGKSGVSTVAPSGTTPQALTGDLNWCYAPEFKSLPLIVPGGFSSVLPNVGYGGIFGQTPMSIAYVDWLRAGAAGLATAGLSGASGAYATWKSIFDYYAPKGYYSQFNFSMAP